MRRQRTLTDTRRLEMTVLYRTVGTTSHHTLESIYDAPGEYQPLLQRIDFRSLKVEFEDRTVEIRVAE